jgi:hypothetical protein
MTLKTAIVAIAERREMVFFFDVSGVGGVISDSLSNIGEGLIIDPR